MRDRWFGLAALGLAVSATGALAADLAPVPAPAPPPAAPACDFFQAELIGVFCGQTAYVAPSGQVSRETINQNSATAGGTTAQRSTYDRAYESMTLAVSPWQGVQFSATGEAFQYDDSYWRQFTPNGGGAPTTTSIDRSGDIAGWQGVGAAATVWDTRFNTPFGNIRSVLDVVGNLEFFPGGGPFRGRDLQDLGWRSGAEMQLGGGLSLDYLATNLFERFDNPGIYEYENTMRVLIASDAYGVAIGPRLEDTTVLGHAAGVNTGWNETRLGGEALLSPFRLTSYPVLRDMTLDVAATHSLGQAALVPNWAGSASDYVFSAEARFNFRF